MDTACRFEHPRYGRIWQKEIGLKEEADYQFDSDDDGEDFPDLFQIFVREGKDGVRVPPDTNYLEVFGEWKNPEDEEEDSSNEQEYDSDDPYGIEEELRQENKQEENSSEFLNKYLTRGLQRQQHRIAGLDLWCLNLEYHWYTFAQWTVSTRLTRFELRNTYLSDAGAETLGWLLQSGSALKEVLVGKIDGSSAWVGSLRHLSPSITHLGLAKITAANIISTVFFMLLHNPNLIEFTCEEVEQEWVWKVNVRQQLTMESLGVASSSRNLALKSLSFREFPCGEYWASSFSSSKFHYLASFFSRAMNMLVYRAPCLDDLTLQFAKGVGGRETKLNNRIEVPKRRYFCDFLSNNPWATNLGSNMAELYLTHVNLCDYKWIVDLIVHNKLRKLMLDYVPQCLELLLMHKNSQPSDEHYKFLSKLEELTIAPTPQNDDYQRVMDTLIDIFENDKDGGPRDFGLEVDGSKPQPLVAQLCLALHGNKMIKNFDMYFKYPTKKGNNNNNNDSNNNENARDIELNVWKQLVRLVGQMPQLQSWKIHTKGILPPHVKQWFCLPRGNLAQLLLQEIQSNHLLEKMRCEAVQDMDSDFLFETIMDCKDFLRQTSNGTTVPDGIWAHIFGSWKDTTCLMLDACFFVLRECPRLIPSTISPSTSKQSVGATVPHRPNCPGCHKKIKAES